MISFIFYCLNNENFVTYICDFVGPCRMGNRVWSISRGIGTGISNISDRNQEVQEAAPRRQPLYDHNASVGGGGTEVARE